MATRHHLITFVAIAHLYSWLMMLPLIVARFPTEWPIPASFGRYTSGWPVIASTLIGTGLIVLGCVVLPASRKLNWAILVSPAVFNYSSLLGGRGYALPQLEARFGAFLGTLILGVLWALWHLPMFLVAEWGHPGFWPYLPMLVSLAFLMSFAAIPAIVMHMIFKTVSACVSGLFADMQPTTSNVFWRMIGIAVKAVLGHPVGVSVNFVVAGGVVVAAALVLTTRGRLNSTTPPAYPGNRRRAENANYNSNPI